ncbi:MAG: GTP-binding protein, partial [Leadbetterella sp.]|nr:GTP-binding protein [Leadbetterella sp.]
WCSMPYQERIRYASFIHNRGVIESRWSRQWGDRMNELVFIGQDMDKEKMTGDLQGCLLTEEEIAAFNQKEIFRDPFPKNI